MNPLRRRFAFAMVVSTPFVAVSSGGAVELPLSFTMEQLAPPVTGSYFRDYLNSEINAANHILAANNCDLRLRLRGDPMVAEISLRASGEDYLDAAKKIPGMIKIVHSLYFGTGSTCIGSRSYTVGRDRMTGVIECTESGSTVLGIGAYRFIPTALLRGIAHLAGIRDANVPQDTNGNIVGPIGPQEKKSLPLDWPEVVFVEGNQPSDFHVTPIEINNAQCSAMTKFAAAQPLLPEPPPPTQSLAEKQSALTARLPFWRSRAMLCDLQGRKATTPAASGFPSKEYAEAAKREPITVCNDGDMALFNGLLCAAGETRGCDGVRNSQEVDNGRWWRSPVIKKRGVDNPDEPNLNSDQALGVMLYTLQQNDSKAFRRWMQWVSRNAPCTSPLCLGLHISVPRYCSLGGSDSNKCMFRPVDCPLIQLIGQVLGEQRAANAVCGPLQWAGLPDPAGFQPRFQDALSHYRAAYNAVNDLQNTIIDLHKKLGFEAPPPPPLPPSPDVLQQKFGSLLKKLDDVRDEAESLIKVPDVGGFAVAYAAAAAIVEANGLINGLKVEKDGKITVSTDGDAASARHLAATAIFLLEKFKIGTPGLKDVANRLLSQQPRNPYFEFLSHGSSPEMLDWILDQCPDSNYDSSMQEPRFQWSWERQDSKVAANQTMYWDCIFIADLYQTGVHAISLPQAMRNFLPKVEEISQHIRDVTGLLEDAIQIVVRELTDLRNLTNELNRQIEFLKSLAAAAAKGALPTYDPKTGVAKLPAPPGTPNVTVNTKKGNVTIGGTCIGHC